MKKFKCSYCPKEYSQNGRWLNNHLRSCKCNPINKSLLSNSFTNNNNKKVKFSFKSSAKNVKYEDAEFLKGFNLTIVDRNTRLELSADESAIFLDTAFNGKNTQA